MKTPKLALAALPALLLVAPLAFVACDGDGNGDATATPGATGEALETATPFPTAEPGAQLSTVEIVQRLSPSVVQVLTEDATQNIFGEVVPSRGIGTGVIIDDEGHILTNNHVVRVGGSPTGPVSSTITVTLFDGSTAGATVVGTDPQVDLAVIKIERQGLVPAELGDTETLPVGSQVVAIGFALGLEGAPSVTSGVVSAKDRTIDQQQGISINGLIQTDASINPGNSGGPLVDDRGRVVGINTAIIANVENVGFAISIDLARPVAQELIANGFVNRGFLGVTVRDVTPGLAASLGLPAEQGVTIDAIVAGSPADDAGLQPSDILIAIGESDIRNGGDLLEALRRHRAGERVTVHYYRDGGEEETDVTVGSRPDS